MEPIDPGNYYGIFQTGLLIALEELGVKQAHLADVCNVSAGYLSKLKGWTKHNVSENLLARPHVINTNFKRLAVPLMQFLEQEHQVRFSEGYFVKAVDNDPPKQWGEINSVLLPEPTSIVSDPDILKSIAIPNDGKLSIEVAIDFTNKKNQDDILNALSYLNSKPNVQLKIKMVLYDSREQINKSDQDDQVSNLYQERAESTPDWFEKTLKERRIQRIWNLLNRPQEENGGNKFSEFISTKDANTGAQREQFCDYSAWEALQQQGDWKYSPEMRIIHGGGMDQYLLSRYSYGAYPFNLQAVLRFDGYAQHTGAHTETANAGLVLGWQSIKGRNQYYHLLLDGQTMRLEIVGSDIGDHYSDFQHLDAGVSFVIDDQAEYQFMLRVTPEKIDVFVDNVLRYQIATPPGMEGQVGIRPWRAQVTCSYFEIWEER